jgi:hypothetical protein
MELMFANTTLFNQPIGDWDVSNVKYMDGMFNNAAAFNQDISAWNISDDIIYEASMFYRCPIKKEYKPKFVK